MERLPFDLMKYWQHSKNEVVPFPRKAFLNAAMLSEIFFSDDMFIKPSNAHAKDSLSKKSREIT